MQVRRWVWVVGVLLGGGGHAAARVCINEILYDPAGPDTGMEFVELYNAGSQAESLEGWVLEAGNGAADSEWRAQWRGQAGDRIAARGFFVVAGSQAGVPAAAIAPLALQNGPDGVRLASPHGIADRVGWGALTRGEYYETSPAPDVPSGWVLARVPDGQDTDDNAADLTGRLQGTPGGPNAPARGVLLGPLRCDPPIFDLDTGGRLCADLYNLGREPLVLADLTWSADCPLLDLRDAGGFTGTLDAAQATECCWQCRPSSTGVATLEVTLRGPALPAVAAATLVRVGRGAVVIAEIQYDPVEEEGEWVELYNRSQQAIDLAGWGVCDASGRTTCIGPGTAILAPHERCLITQDRLRFLRRWPDTPADRIVPRQGTWPSLNNTVDRERGYADEVLLYTGAGVPEDYVRYAPGALDGNGISLERWIEGGELIHPEQLVPCSSPGGATPGTSSWQLTNPEGSEWLAPQPQPYRPDSEERLCRIAIPGSAAGAGEVSVDLYSLAGRRVATLSSAAATHGPTVVVWDGRTGNGDPAPTGLYLLRIVTRDAATGGPAVAVRPLTLVRG